MDASERFGPFSVRTQNPLYLMFLNLRPERPVTLSQGVAEVGLESAYSSLFEVRSSGVTGNSLDLDMEVWRLGIIAKYGLSDRLDLGIEIPLLRFSGGFLDPFIQSYHDAFGFPNAGRETVPDGSFTYRVGMNNAALYNVSRQAIGLGDVSLEAKYLLSDEDRWPALALQPVFKIPTGQRSRGFGSGTPDGALFVLAEKGWRRLTGYANVGPLFLGGAAPLAPISRQWGVAWMTALEWNFIDPVSAVLQFNGTTPLYHGTGFTQTDDDPLDLTIGVKGQKKQWIWAASFTEDPGANDPSVDFTVFLSLGYRWKLAGSGG